MNTSSRASFLAERRAGIGGSDIAAMLGMSPYRTPYQLWLEKTGRTDGADNLGAEDIERMHWGTVLEDVVARHYAELHGVKTQRINSTLRHPDVPIALANIDRVVVVSGSRARWDAEDKKVLGADRLLEVKTAHALAQNSVHWGAPGSDEVPQPYWLQVQWYLGITGLAFADLAVLFGGQRYAEYTITADRHLFADLLAEADGWWQRHVVADVPPPANSEEDAKRIWLSHTAGKTRAVDVTVADLVAELASVKSQIKALEAQEQELRDKLLPIFEDAESLTYLGRPIASWKANKESEKTDWKAVAEELRPYAGLEFEAAVFANTVTVKGARVLRLNTKEN